MKKKPKLNRCIVRGLKIAASLLCAELEAGKGGNLGGCSACEWRDTELALDYLYKICEWSDKKRTATGRDE